MNMTFTSKHTHQCRIFSLMMIMMLVLTMPQPISAQDQGDIQSLRDTIDRLTANQEQIQRQIDGLKSSLQELRRVLSPPPANPVVSYENQPVLGKEDASLIVVEFTDYQCPFCRRHVAETFPLLQRDFIDTGKVKYIVRDFPLESIHPNAVQAAVAANCAGLQGRYWEMHDQLFRMEHFQEADWTGEGKKLGLEPIQFQRCLEDEQSRQKVNEDIQAGIKARVSGTPTFFLGYTDRNDGQLQTSLIIRGAQPYAHFKQAIEKLLTSRP